MNDPVTDIVIPTWLAHRPIIDLCYCATAGLINGRVLKTVNYKKEHFELKKWTQ